LNIVFIGQNSFYMRLCEAKVIALSWLINEYRCYGGTPPYAIAPILIDQPTQRDNFWLVGKIFVVVVVVVST